MAADIAKPSTNITPDNTTMVCSALHLQANSGVRYQRQYFIGYPFKYEINFTSYISNLFESIK